MKKLIILLSFVLTLSMNAQDGMVIIKGFSGQQIEVSDSISEKTVKRFIHYMERNPIDYEEALRKIIAVKPVVADRTFVSELKDGIIFFNERLNDFPSTKEVIILHHLAENTGMKTVKGTRPHVHYRNFNITSYNEELFRRQLVRHNPYKLVVKKLIEENPLRTKL